METEIALLEIPPGYRTTYSDVFQAPRTCKLPPIKFHQLPSLSLDQSLQLQPRQFPLEPMGPRRIIEIDQAPCLGLGTTCIRTDKLRECDHVTESVARSIQRGKTSMDLANQSAKKKPRPPSRRKRIRREVLDAVVNDLVYTSTTKQAADEACLPVINIEPPATTLEPNSDVVKYRPQKYAHEAGMWQTVGWQWDRVQLRHRTGHWNDDAPSKKPKRQSVRWADDAEAEKEEEEEEDLEDNVTISSIGPARFKSYGMRPMPGYGGYRPMYPVEGHLDHSIDHNRDSVLKASYGVLPVKRLQFAHKGPLSKTVTLTYPYNPFNKVEKRIGHLQS